MPRYNLNLDDADREKMAKDMKAEGHVQSSTFLRMLIRKWPFKDGKEFSANDMKAFARGFAAYEIEPEDMNRHLEQFKNNK